MELTPHGTIQQPMVAMYFSNQAEMEQCPFSVARHWHQSVEILQVLRGEMRVELDLEEYCLHQGDICIINSGELHQISGCHRGTIHRVVLFDPVILSFAYEDEIQTQIFHPLRTQQLTFPSILPVGSPMYQACSSTIITLMDTALNQREDWYFRCKLLLLELVYTLYQTRGLTGTKRRLTPVEKEQIHRFKLLVCYMQQHYAEKLTLQDLAQVAGYNSQYLCRFFKQFSGQSPMDYLIVLRIQRAADLLSQTTRPVLEIAMDCGFDNVSYFIRAFKHRVGQTPKQYRLHTQEGVPFLKNNSNQPIRRTVR